MAGNSEDQLDFRTPEKACIRVPCGHILVSAKWRNSEITKSFQGLKVIYEENLGSVDFHPGPQIGVVYASEADMVSQASLRRRLAKLRKANTVQVHVLAEKTPSSSQYFPPLQRYVVLELGFSLTPVPGQLEAAGILTQMVLTESKVESNPFRKSRRQANLDEAMLATVQSIPKLGAVKARKLLEHFHSLHAIGAASSEDLAAVVGKASAVNIRAFFTAKDDT